MEKNDAWIKGLERRAAKSREQVATVSPEAFDVIAGRR
jgi:hypothetical protein